MKIIAIYDNSGKTWDRYTVITDQKYEKSANTFWLILGLSENANSPSGFGQCSEGIYDPSGRRNRHLGHRIRFEDLSAELQQHIAFRLFTDN